jgi:hypothetical protein
LIAHAELGEEARKFIESDLGKAVLGMAQQEIDAALQDLASVDPADTKKITKLQNQAALGRMFASWLGELINKGANAMEVYKHES